MSGYPTILFINKSGEVEGKIGGYEPAEGFTQDLTKIVTAHRDLPRLEAEHRAKPDDAGVSARLAAIYAGRGQADKAEPLLAAAAKADPQNKSGELAKAYNALGDYYQDKQKFARAVPLFRDGARVAKTPYERAYANISAAVCLLSQQKLKEATPYLSAVASDAAAPAEYRTQAQQMLAAVKKQAGGK